MPQRIGFSIQWLVKKKGYCSNMDYSHSNKQLSCVQYVTAQTSQSEI